MGTQKHGVIMDPKLLAVAGRRDANGGAIDGLGGSSKGGDVLTYGALLDGTQQGMTIMMQDMTHVQSGVRCNIISHSALHDLTGGDESSDTSPRCKCRWASTACHRSIGVRASTG